MRVSLRNVARGKRFAALQAASVVVLIATLTAVSVPGTGALFTGDYPDVVTISTGQIFPAEHVSPAFAVTDHSSGSATDVSSPVASAADGLSATTSAWPAAFASDHYVDLRLNEILPRNVTLSAASFDMSWASVAGTACLYIEVRDAGGTLIDSEGNAGSPLSCTSSATPVDLVTPLPGLALSDDADAARVRIFVSSSSAAATVLDRTVLKVTFEGEQFTLYPVDVVDVADGTPSLTHWGLAGP